MKFRKKPVVIEAIQFDGTTVCRNEIFDWAHKDLPAGAGCIIRPGDGPVMMIKTLEGDMRAEAGDMIIKGVKGEFYSCKPDIFSMTYEAVE